MKRNMMGIAALCAISLITNYTFGAGARITAPSDRGLAVFLSLTDGNMKSSLIPAGGSVEIDAFLAGFTGVKWVDCGKIYEAKFAARIEGTEGWRAWDFLKGSGELYIGGSGILGALGIVRGQLIKSGECPCIIPQAVGG
jgi:hypothetical protein